MILLMKRKHSQCVLSRGLDGFMQLMIAKCSQHVLKLFLLLPCQKGVWNHRQEGGFERQKASLTHHNLNRRGGHKNQRACQRILKILDPVIDHMRKHALDKVVSVQEGYKHVPDVTSSI